MAYGVTLGGSNIREYCQSVSVEQELNLTHSASVVVPSSLVSLTEGADRLVVTDDGTTVMDGRAVFGEDDGGPDSKMRTITARDSRCFWDRQQVMDPDGDYSDPSIIEDNEDAVSIFAAAISNWNSFEGGSDISVGTAAGGGTPLVGFRPVDWPITIEALREMLVNTGQLDVIPNHGSGTVDLFNGDAGTDLSGSVALEYDTGSRNCSGAKYTFDFSKTVSRIRYFLGPKRPQYDGDIQHWARDVQIDDPALDAFDGAKQAVIDGLSSGVEGLLGLLRRIEVYDSNGDENALKDLYLAIWQSDALIYFRPRRLLNLTPELGVRANFQPGDLISTAAVLGESHSAVQRVYKYSAVEDTEGNVQLTVQVSADQET